ncbi:MAG: Hsp20/alpha crystallin family protein [Nitrospira sp.]|nr:Hsp20/alpha crystallin family protein [Nitrospira sp.]
MNGKLVRWSPMRELEEMSERLNRVFARQSAGESNGKELMTVADWDPPVDISETDEAFHIAAELPDVKRDDVKVTVENGVLTLQGERREEREEEGFKIHRRERSCGKFVRSFTLPDVIDAGKVTAAFKDGVLHLHLPKLEKALPKTIEVQLA